MPEHRRRFSPQFKADAVQMVIETGRPVAEVARDLHDGTLGNWVNAWRHVNPEPGQAMNRTCVLSSSALNRSWNSTPSCEALAAAHTEAIAAGLGKRGQVALVRTERPH